MKVLISGSNGLIGSALAASLEADGCDVVRINRSDRSEAPFFDISPDNFEGADAVVNLCGFGIMRRWTSAAKREIKRSRVESAGFFADMFSALNRPPKLFLCASATGFYGNRGDEELTEKSAAGNGFPSAVALRWEDAANRSASSETRVANLRFGVVFSRNAPMLRMAKTVFSLGLGATAGDGNAWLSWVSLNDTVRAIRFLIENGGISGPVNIVSPSPVKSGDFSRTVGRVLKRPVFFTVPKRIIKLILGEMGEEIILASARVAPQKLLENGFRFEDGNLEIFLRSELLRSEIGGGQNG